MRHTCAKCGKPRGICRCLDVCQRCLWPESRCQCEESLRVMRYDQQEEGFQEDEERADDFARDYGSTEEKSRVYWHGFNTIKRNGKRLVTCPYEKPVERKDFYRGVSDARSSY